MKPLAARACARPLTAPSTMTLLECAINCRIRRGHGRVRRRATVPPLLPLDSLVGSLAARPIGSFSTAAESPRFLKDPSAIASPTV